MDTLCNRRSVNCPHCRQKRPQRELEQHINQCDEAAIPCAATSIGCSVMRKRAEIAAHEQSCLLASVLPTIQGLNSRLDNQGATLEVLQRKNTLLESSILALQAIADDALPNVRNAVSVSQDAESTNASLSQQSLSSGAPPFDSATHHLLSLYESMRAELDRVSAGVSELDGRSSMMLMNETLRIREEMSHANAAIGSLRVQLQWLMSAKLQAQSRLSGSANPAVVLEGPMSGRAPVGLGHPIRRLSDPARQETKL